MDVSQQILEKIEKEKIHPAPRYAILLKRSVFWSLMALALAIGSLAAAVAIFSIANTEWDIWARASGSIWKYVFLVFPYFWLVIFAGFILLAHYNMRHTKFGYRFSLFKVIFAYLAITVFAGMIFYRFGIGSRIEESLAETSSYYRHLQGVRTVWLMPEKGLLGGRIEAEIVEQNFILIDQDGMRWQVTVSGTLGAENAFPGARVKIVGERFGTSSFSAVEIRSWCGCGGCVKEVSAGCMQASELCAMGSPCEHGCGL